MCIKIVQGNLQVYTPFKGVQVYEPIKGVHCGGMNIKSVQGDVHRNYVQVCMSKLPLYQNHRFLNVNFVLTTNCHYQIVVDNVVVQKFVLL